MSHHIVITKSYKNVGVSVLLTLFLGPLGLFYASVTGGIVMLFAPILTTVVLLYNAYAHGYFNIFNVFDLIATLLASYAIYLFYWVVSIIWGIWATVEYNSDLERQARIIEPQQEIPVYHKPNSDFMEWIKSNPGKSVNDFYSSLKRKG